MIPIVKHVMVSDALSISFVVMHLHMETHKMVWKDSGFEDTKGSELRKISGLAVPLGPILGSTEWVKHLKIANWRTKIILKISWVPPWINEDTRKLVCACTDDDWTFNWWMFMPNEWWWHYLVRSLEKIHESDSMMKRLSIGTRMASFAVISHFYA